MFILRFVTFRSYASFPASRLSIIGSYVNAICDLFYVYDSFIVVCYFIWNERFFSFVVLIKVPALSSSSFSNLSVVDG